MGARAPVLTETEDLSHAGLALRLPPPLRVDDRVVVVLRPGGAIIPVLGRVAWLAGDAAVAGVEFERLTPGPERTLRAVLDWHEAAALGIRRRGTALSTAQN